jgi:anti-sigma B factor antagonist
LETQLSIGVREQAGSTVLVVRGELDIASNPQLEEALERAFRSEAELVVLDLGELEFMDVTSLRVLAGAHEQAQQCAKRLVLVNVGGQIRRLLTLTRVIDMLSIDDGSVLGAEERSVGPQDL